VSACRRCGAETGAAPQCPACGSVADSDFDLDLDHVNRARLGPGDTATDAQIGGGVVSLGGAAPRPAPLARPTPTGRSFQEQHAAADRLTWRVGRIPVLIILGWMSASHLLLDSHWVFIDNVNLLLHEAGHVMFSWGGDQLAALGGTIGQLMWPALFAGYFYWRRHERFASVVAVWWFGENLIGIARYLQDGPRESLPLVGGNVHDWNFLLGRWGLLSSADEIAATVRFIGAATMVASLVLLLVWTIRPSARELAP
jgi:hypothetical protein